MPVAGAREFFPVRCAFVRLRVRVRTRRLCTCCNACHHAFGCRRYGDRQCGSVVAGTACSRSLQRHGLSRPGEAGTHASDHMVGGGEGWREDRGAGMCVCVAAAVATGRLRNSLILETDATRHTSHTIPDSGVGISSDRSRLGSGRCDVSYVLARQWGCTVDPTEHGAGEQPYFN